MIVKQESFHLLELINGLLDLSKIESGKMDIIKSNFDLKNLITQVGPIVSVLAEGKNLIYKEIFKFEGDAPIYSDKTKVRQIIINLLSNAVKYSNSGTILIELNRDESFYFIEVKDEGIGIPEENLEEIFDKFRQLDGSYIRKSGGTGLGLSIVKHYSEMLGGSVEVESSLGAGSCFRVYIPKEIE
jgi:signal transduction histidine kinase